MAAILATLCYLMKDGKTLMLHRVKKDGDYHKDKWNGLGGKFEEGETPEECVIREVQEESGLLLVNPQMKGFISFPLFDGKNDWSVFVFKAENFTGELIDSPEGNLEWIPDDMIFELNLWEGDRIYMPWLIQDKFFSAKFVYKNGEFKEYSVCFY